MIRRFETSSPLKSALDSTSFKIREICLATLTGYLPAWNLSVERL